MRAARSPNALRAIGACRRRQVQSDPQTALNTLAARGSVSDSPLTTATGVRRPLSNRAWRPIYQRSADFSGSPNGCSMAGSRSASATFTNRYAETASRSMSRPATSRRSGRSCRSNPSRGSRTRRPSARALSASGAKSLKLWHPHIVSVHDRARRSTGAQSCSTPSVS